MSRQAAELRVRVEAFARRRSHRGQRYPKDLRADLVEYARSREQEEASLREVEEEVGVRHETLRRWLEASGEASSPSTGFIPVKRVVDREDGSPPEARQQDGGLTVVSPGGWRIEGATRADVIELMRSVR